MQYCRALLPSLLILNLITVSCQTTQEEVRIQDDADFFQEEKKQDQATPTPGIETGYAAWYGNEMHGQMTVSGKRFNMHKKMGVHKSFPLGSLVKVKNLDNNNETEVTIVDRGPYVDGRIIDVSYAVAKILGFSDQGIAKVEISLLKEGSLNRQPGGKQDGIGKYTFPYGARPNGYTVQIGAFKIRKNAERYKKVMAKKYSRTTFLAIYKDWHIVWLGDFQTKQDVQKFVRKIKATNQQAAYIVSP